MADRTFYRDPTTGRFISADQASELERAIQTRIVGGFREETILAYGEEPGPEEEDYESRDVSDSKWGAKMDFGGAPLATMQRTLPPENATDFRITYTKPPGVPGESGYRGMITGSWRGIALWGQQEAEFRALGATGIGFVVFDYGDQGD